MSAIFHATKKLTAEYSLMELFFGVQYINYEFDQEKFIRDSKDSLTFDELEFYTHLSRIQSKVNSLKLEQFVNSSCIPEPWIIGYQIESTKQRNGYVLILDHKIKAVCLYINGTQGYKDLVTDLKADPVEFQEGFVHKGMLKIVGWYIENLKELMKELLNKNPNYGLLIIGHSLGAGIASILSMSIIEDFPILKCIAFATPSCVSSNLSSKCSKYVTTFVNSNDFVPRFSMWTLREMKKKLPTDWIEQFHKDVDNNESKWVKGLKKTGAIDYFFGKPNKDMNITTDEIDGESVMINEIKDETVEENEEENEETVSDTLIKLHPTGRIYHVHEFDNIMYLKECEMTDFEELIFIANYIEDHKMANYHLKLEKLRKKLKNLEYAKVENSTQEVEKQLDSGKESKSQEEKQTQKEVKIPPIPKESNILMNLKVKLPPIPNVKPKEQKETVIKLPPTPVIKKNAPLPETE
jgi:hypothetical protein